MQSFTNVNPSNGKKSQQSWGKTGYDVKKKKKKDLIFIQLFIQIYQISDNEPPRFDPSIFDEFFITIVYGNFNATVTWDVPTATDNSGIPPTVTGSHVPPIQLTYGTYTVVYIATDYYGNRYSISFTFTISGKYSILL